MPESDRRVSLTDVLDRVLDKGIVIDAGIRVSVIGIELLGVSAKITVASIETYLQLANDPRSRQLGLVGEWRPRSTAPARAAPPAPEEPRPPLAAYHDEDLSTSPPDDEAGPPGPS